MVVIVALTQRWQNGFHRRAGTGFVALINERIGGEQALL